MTEVIGSTKRRARKQHTCDHCRTPIEPGEEYDRCFLKDGADLSAAARALAAVQEPESAAIAARPPSPSAGKP